MTTQKRVLNDVGTRIFRGTGRRSAGAMVLALALLVGCAAPKKSAEQKPAPPPKPTVDLWGRPRFSPDGSRLAALRNEETVYEFALPGDLTGREVSQPFGRADMIVDVQYNEQGDLLILGQRTNELALWSARQGVAVAHRELRTPVFGGLMSRDGQQAVLYFEGKPGRTNTPVSLVRWNLEPVALPDHDGILCLAFSGDGQRLATVDHHRLCRIWNATSGALLLALTNSDPRSISVALDEHGDRVAVAARETRIQGVEPGAGQPATVPAAAPKTTTFMGGVGIILLEVAVGLGGHSDVMWDPHWFKSAPTLGLCLSRDGSRVAMLNPAPNMKGEFQVRVAGAETGLPEAVYGLGASFLPWGVFPDLRAIMTYHAPGDRTAGQPVFSPDGRRIAVPGNGVRVMEAGASDASKRQPLWLARARPTGVTSSMSKHEIPYIFEVQTVRATNSVSSLARAAHHRVTFEQTADLSGNDRWEVPIGLGMKDVFYPNCPAGPLANTALKTVWQDCGHELVQWDPDLYLSSRVTQWRLDVHHSFTKGWEMSATIEIEIDLHDRAGTILHTGRYQGQDSRTRLWEPSGAFIGEMHNRALNDCLAEMKNDPKWEQVLASNDPMGH